jgi:hypothetical protein
LTPHISIDTDVIDVTTICSADKEFITVRKWKCEGDLVFGYGDTPKQAYEAWHYHRYHADVNRALGSLWSRVRAGRLVWP